MPRAVHSIFGHRPACGRTVNPASTMPPIYRLLFCILATPSWFDHYDSDRIPSKTNANAKAAVRARGRAVYCNFRRRLPIAGDMVFRAANAVNDLRPLITARSLRERVIDSVLARNFALPSDRRRDLVASLCSVPCAPDAVALRFASALMHQSLASSLRAGKGTTAIRQRSGAIQPTHPTRSPCGYPVAAGTTSDTIS